MLDQVPVEHLSYSSMMQFVSNPAMFKKKYILHLFDSQLSLSAAAGRGFHAAMEHYYKDNSRDNAMKHGLDHLQMIPDSKIDWGKTGDREKLVKKYTNAFNFYMDEKPDMGKIIDVELKHKAQVKFDDDLPPIPVPLKGYIDIVSEKDGELRLWDFKTTASHTPLTEMVENENGEMVEKEITVFPDYEMQALTYYYLAKNYYKREPKKFTFIEIKVSKNRDNGPQIQYIDIDFTKDMSQIKRLYQNFYASVIRLISMPDYPYLPNIRDMFSGREGYMDYISEVLDFEPVKQISKISDTEKNVTGYKETKVDISEDINAPIEEQIVSKLNEFGAYCQYKETIKGPNVTLYTMKPSRGVEMRKYKKHEDDIAVKIGASSVRVQAPLFGTKTFGVEVTNEEQKVVQLLEEYYKKDSLRIPVGMNVFGEIEYYNLNDAPHFLVAGATGSGKSVFLDTIIDVLSKQLTPSDLELILIDPKMVEFIGYRNLPHLEAPPLTEMPEIVGALNYLVDEMNDRYRRLMDMGVKNIDQFRNKGGNMKYIVCIVDELGDIILEDDNNKVRKQLTILAQKARAAGIHLVLATQRPSHDVIPGVLKNNLPVRIAFSVPKKVDSQVIIDESGAEKLMGKGDMLFQAPNIDGILRLQGLYRKIE